jgi:hypothetical protein
MDDSNPFNKKTKFDGDAWFGVFIFLFCSLVFLLWGLDNDSFGWRLIVVAVGIGVAFCTWMVSLGGVLSNRDTAVDQCLLLADKIGLSVSHETLLSLQRKGSAGDVFVEFVRLLPSENLTTSKDSYFASSGGQSPESCRKFVGFLFGNPSEYRQKVETAEAQY